jgi:hypothetical protein
MMWMMSCASSKVVLIDLRKARENDLGRVRAADIAAGADPPHCAERPP